MAKLLDKSDLIDSWLSLKFSAWMCSVQELCRKRDVLSRTMATRYHQGQEFLEYSNEQLELHRGPIKAELNRVGVPSEEWLVDFLLVLGATRRDEANWRETTRKTSQQKVTSYGDIFESDVEILGLSSSATSAPLPTKSDAHIWNRQLRLSDNQNELVDLVFSLQTARRISLETLTRQCINLNVPASRLNSLHMYLDWCILYKQSVLHTLLKFDYFESHDQLGWESEFARRSQFQQFRGIIVGRLLEGIYLSFSDFVRVAVETTSSIDDIEELLSHYVRSRSALDDFIQELRIVSRSSQGIPQRVIATEVEVSREKVRSILRSHSLVAKNGFHTSTISEDALIVERILNCVRESPGISVQEISNRLEIDDALCSRCIPTAIMKFISTKAKRAPTKHWSDEQIIGILQLAATFEYPLSAHQYDSLRRAGAFDGPSAVLVCMRFGEWTSACRAAGIDSGSRRSRDYERTWTEEGLWKIVTEYFLDPHTSGTLSDFDSWLRSEEAAPSRATFRLRFGSWAAIRAEVFLRLATDEYFQRFQSYCDEVMISEEAGVKK